MACQHDTAPSAHRGTLHDVHPRAILAYEIHVGGGEVISLMTEVAREVERLEENLRHYDRRTEIQHDPACKAADDPHQPMKVREAAGPNRRAVGRGMHV